ncbi:low molecular weight phosphotyrosine protein phosphatase [Moraxella nasovis]|uniref:low molecular weight protein-tyrosine-phosphatase n=1 Tax=Moraxella nasovis TaxID=2904121 RepID=UPI001F610968|nr:low molecular weight protein-tyrosine-phosphatase [Moraxella nasovis]UNU72967.1 low molecular weight phosphotyrosine protein phosphatase [Moraxella nasovis]
MITPKSILFVCLGNICRSPSAEGVMRAKCKQAGLDITIDSAGTADYHIGEQPDSRAIAVGKQLGYQLENLQARQVKPDDFHQFDIIFAMDDSNLANLQKLQAAVVQPTAKLLSFDPSGQIADPYYGDKNDFVKMFDHIIKVTDNWLKLWQSYS